MNVRSIHFRLISWYTVLMVLVCLGFGIYTYNSLSSHLYTALDMVMKRRTAVLGRGVLSFYAERGIDYLSNEIQAIFATEENSRFVRITDESKAIIYLSGIPKNERFNPRKIPVLDADFADQMRREIPVLGDAKLIILATHFSIPSGEKFLIEVGDTTESITATLNTLWVDLSFGLPLVILLAIGGGYVLIQNSLRPVENIRKAAEKISLTNLKKRLPVENSGDSIEYLSHTLNHMIHRLEGAYQQVQQFSADASHELRTPLTVIRGELESIILEPILSSDLRKNLGVVLEEAERLTMIAEGLFAISRLDAGEARLQTVVVDLANLAKTTLEHMRLLAEEKNIEVIFYSNKEVYIKGDPGRLKQVIVNLLDNAIKYTPIGGQISLNIYIRRHKAVLEVSDNGIGIAAADKERVFERFYRADKVRTRELGAGLGLSIVRSICMAHHATIRLESEENTGSNFIVEFESTPLEVAEQ